MEKEEKNTSLVNVNADLTGIQVQADIAKILPQLIDPSAKGLNKVFVTLFGDRYAKQIRHVLLTETQTSVDQDKIMSGTAKYDSKSKQLIETSSKDLLISIIQDEELMNILSCALKAGSHIKIDPEHTSIPSKYFINMWRNNAKQVGDEEMREIWGRILAEEINSPNTISLRTLDIIKNITSTEARLFMEMSKWVVWGKHVFSDYIYKRNEFKGFDLLSEIGLVDLTQIKEIPLGTITSGSWLIEKQKVNDNKDDIECYTFKTKQDLFLVPKENIDHDGHIPRSQGFALTGVGKELYRIIDLENAYDDNLYSETLKHIYESINSIELLKDRAIYHARIQDGSKSLPEKIPPLGIDFFN